MHRRSLLPLCLMFVTLGACARQEAAPAAAPTAAAPAAPASTPAPTVSPLQPNAALSPELQAHLVRPHSPVIGPANAPVTLVEFLDPACGACAAFSPVVKQIQLLYPKEVRVVVRFAAFHQGSDQAIRLLVASKKQGKFEQVLDGLFERQEEWASHQAPNIPHIGKIAIDVGVDLPKARIDAASPAATAVLQQDNEDIVALKVERTPTFYVNGRSLDEFGPEQLIGLVREEVDKTKK